MEKQEVINLINEAQVQVNSFNQDIDDECTLYKVGMHLGGRLFPVKEFELNSDYVEVVEINTNAEFKSHYVPYSKFEALSVMSVK